MPTKKWKDIPPRVCAVCDAKFYRYYGERVRDFNRRATCGTVCGGKLSAETRLKKYGRAGRPPKCAICGNSVPPPPRQKCDRQRQTCGDACANRLRALNAATANKQTPVFTVPAGERQAALDRAEQIYAQYRDVDRIDYSGKLAA